MQEFRIAESNASSANPAHGHPDRDSSPLQRFTATSPRLKETGAQRLLHRVLGVALRRQSGNELTAGVEKSANIYELPHPNHPDIMRRRQGNFHPSLSR